MVEEAKRLYGSSPECLISVLDPHCMYSISRFSIDLSQPEQGGSGYDPDEWKWLASLLIEAAKINTVTILPQIVNLIYKEDRGIHDFIFSFPFLSMSAYFFLAPSVPLLFVTQSPLSKKPSNSNSITPGSF